MIKRFGLFFGAVLIFAFALYTTHQYLLTSATSGISFPILGMYIFHLVSFMVIGLGVEYMSVKLPSQVGYTYLATVFVKIGLFVLIFQNAIFSEIDLNMEERLSIVVPMFAFLILEAVYCGRLMNSK